MPVLAVINAKGGSGKSTLATSISAYAVSVGIKLMLGDLDPQQSIRTWLRLRSEKLPIIASWLVDSARVFRPPAGVTHAVLDTPSGISGLYLARIVMASNVVLIPVAASAFDRDAATEFITNLRLLPRVASGQCTLICIGVRIQPDSVRARALQAWADAQNIQLLGVIRNSSVYLSCVDHGSSIFDIESTNALALREDWQPLLTWLSEFFLGNLPVSNLNTANEVNHDKSMAIHHRTKQAVESGLVAQLSGNKHPNDYISSRTVVIESQEPKAPTSNQPIANLPLSSFLPPNLGSASAKQLANINQNVHSFLLKENF